jgi:hypothetical protein
LRKGEAEWLFLIILVALLWAMVITALLIQRSFSCCSYHWQWLTFVAPFCFAFFVFVYVMVLF